MDNREKVRNMIVEAINLAGEATALSSVGPITAKEKHKAPDGTEKEIMVIRNIAYQTYITVLTNLLPKNMVACGDFAITEKQEKEPWQGGPK